MAEKSMYFAELVAVVMRNKKLLVSYDCYQKGYISRQSQKCPYHQQPARLRWERSSPAPAFQFWGDCGVRIYGLGLRGFG